MLLSSKNTRWSKKYHSRMIVQATPVIVHHACCIFRKLPCHHSSFFLYPKFFVLFLRLLLPYYLPLASLQALRLVLLFVSFLPLLYKYYCYLWLFTSSLQVLLLFELSSQSLLHTYTPFSSFCIVNQ